MTNEKTIETLAAEWMGEWFEENPARTFRGEDIPRHVASDVLCWDGLLPEDEDAQETAIDALIAACVAAHAKLSAGPAWQPVDGEITSIDLVAECQGPLPADEPVESTRFRLESGGSVCEAVYLPRQGRAGVTLGAGAIWTEASSLEDGIRRVLTGAVVR